MSGVRLLALLDERLHGERVGDGQPVTVAELHKRLVPYHLCRERLGYASKAEYDGQILALLADDRTIAVSDPDLRVAVLDELDQPEPGLGFLHRFAATEIRRVGPLSSEHAPAESVPEVPEEHGAAGATCRECAAPLPHATGAWFCPACGTDQRVPCCSACGAEVHDNWRYCAFCGILQGRTADG